MKYMSGLLTGCIATACLAAATWWIVAAQRTSNPKDKPTPPATVGKVVKEGDLNIVTLTDEAVKTRLRVKTGTVKKESVRRTRVYGGDVIVPLGQTGLAAAPLSGILSAPENGVPRPGQNVRKGQPILMLSPLLTPESAANLATQKVDVDGQVKNAETAKRSAKELYDRAKSLFKEQAGSKKDVEINQAAYDIAVETLEAAKSRQSLLKNLLTDFAKGTTSPIAIESPIDGILRHLASLPGQPVSSGAALFEVVNLDRLWIRTPLPVCDLGEIAVTDPVIVGSLAGKANDPTREAKPVVAPPAANALAATVDLFHEIDNRPLWLTPGQRVGVNIPLRGEAESLTAPWSAIIHDIHGGTWLYEATSANTFVRRRVTVRQKFNDLAILTQGPSAGATVVTEGAQEIFAVESGFSK